MWVYLMVNLKVPSSNGVSCGPKITAFQSIMSFSHGAPLTPERLCYESLLQKTSQLAAYLGEGLPEASWNPSSTFFWLELTFCRISWVICLLFSDLLCLIVKDFLDFWYLLLPNISLFFLISAVLPTHSALNYMGRLPSEEMSQRLTWFLLSVSQWFAADVAMLVF